MKFISKNLNLRVVLKPGIQGERLTGRPPVAGVYGRFEQGILTVNDEATILMLKAHPAFNVDYIAVENDEQEALANAMAQRSSEPEHDIINIDYGHVGKNLNPRPAMTISPEIKAFLTEQAMGMAKEMAKEMTKQALADIAGTLAEAKKSLPAHSSSEPLDAKPEDQVKSTSPKVKTSKSGVTTPIE